MIASLLLALLPLQEPAGDVRPIDPAQAIDAGFLGDQIDLSLHWLHTRFEVEQGTFGGPEADAWALLAFAGSPRAYRPSEGPFLSRPLAALVAAQKPDGSYAPEVPAEVVLRVFELFREPSAEGAAARLRARLGALPTQAAPASVEEAVARARAVLVARNRDASWGEGARTVVTTAQRLDELNRLQAFLRAHEPAHGPRDVHPLPGVQPAPAGAVERALERGARFLLSQSVEGGFGFGGHRDAGITAMVLGGLQALPAPRPEPVEKAISAGLDWLLALQHEDGSIHEGQTANYVTSAAVLALARSGRPEDLRAIARARVFLERLQADEGEHYSPADRFYGGVGYGDDEKPDLSNMQMALEALHTAGVPTGDATFQKALVFLQRCQNHSESNDLALVADGKTIVSGNDGGANYAPGESKAGFIELPDGKRVPRSYGSMSYALLKGYLFAGLAREDPRVVAVWKWLRENYTLDVNPGFQASVDPVAPYQGLFYYFYTMAKALDLYGEERITDGAGREHDWRGELCGRLTAMQRQDGSWVNTNASRWFEGEPVLATAYALMTLGTARPR